MAILLAFLFFGFFNIMWQTGSLAAGFASTWDFVGRRETAVARASSLHAAIFCRFGFCASRRPGCFPGRLPWGPIVRFRLLIAHTLRQAPLIDLRHFSTDGFHVSALSGDRTEGCSMLHAGAFRTWGTLRGHAELQDVGQVSLRGSHSTELVPNSPERECGPD